MRRAAAAAALLLAACESRGTSCPGDVQGTLGFLASGDPLRTTCAYFAAHPPGARFPATVSWVDVDNANVCVERPLSEVKPAVRNPPGGDSFATLPSSGTAVAGAIGTCPCTVATSEVFSGTLVRDPAGKVIGFAGGALDATLTRDPSASACYQAADAAQTAGDCPPAGGCTVHYEVTAP